MFAWAQNLLSQSYNSDELKDMKYQSASVFALLWNVCKRLLPYEVINDYQEYLTQHNMCRMNPVTRTPGATGEYSIGKQIFRHHELAPPSGQFTSNYIRLVRKQIIRILSLYIKYRKVAKNIINNLFTDTHIMSLTQQSI